MWNVVHGYLEHERIVAGLATVVLGCGVLLWKMFSEINERKRIETQIRRQTELLHNIIAHIPNHVFWKDLNSVYLGCNLQFAQTAGLKSAEQIVGKTDFDLPWTRQEAEDYRSYDRAVMTEGASRSNLEESQRTANGKITTVLTSKVPLRDSDGKIFGVLGMYTDITEREQTESKLRSRLAAIDAAADMVVITDPDGTIEYVNPAFVRTTGFSLQEAIGANPRLLRSDKHSPEFYTKLWSTIISGKVWNGEMINRRKDGSLYPEEMTITPVLDAQGKPICFVAIKRDITLRRQREALELEHRALVEAVAAMEHVLGVVGHELRTPLAGIRAMSEFLLDENARQTPEGVGFLGSIHDEIVRMTETVNNLLEAARLNSGKSHWDWQRVDLPAVCSEAIETIRPLVDAACVELIKPPLDSAQMIAGDPSAIRRLLVNVLSNARKHTTRGHIRISLEASQTDGAGWMQITVSDTGRGIAPSIVNRLGEAFSLNSGAVGANYIQGTGLGLAICKGIAAAHGGAISIESGVGRGTSVCVRLRSDLRGPVLGIAPGKLVAHVNN